MKREHDPADIEYWLKHVDHRDALDDRYATALLNVQADIKRAFNSRGDVSLIGVPSFSARTERYCLLPFAEAVSETIEGYPVALQALVKVLTASDCPIVQELRDALASEYAKAHADDIAEVLS